MTALFIFGMGYTGSRLGEALGSCGWLVRGTGNGGTCGFEDQAAVREGLGMASHILSCVPPGPDGDPVLQFYGDALRGKWLGYLSSTGVYGDTEGAWADENAPLNGRRSGRIAADREWQAQSATIFRLPGIYGPGRSALERVVSGRAHRVALPEQVFSRVHVDDIVTGVINALDCPPGVFNLADDEPGPQDDVVTFAARLMKLPVPPIVDIAALTPLARAFYTENRRVANGRARRLLNWAPVIRVIESGCARSAL